MGTIKSNGKCFISNLPAEDVLSEVSNWKGYEYKVKTGQREYKFLLSEEANKWYTIPIFKDNRHILAGLIINNNWTKEDINFIEDVSFFEKILKEKSYPITPKQKDFLFHKLYKNISFGGNVTRITRNQNDSTPYEYYFINNDELRFYLYALEESGLVKIEETSTWFDIEITFEGLNYGIQLEDEGELSNNCFIAMAFRDETKDVRLVIKEVVIKTGFDPVLIDEKNIESDKTINDEIINNIKKCKFCIADFSFHSAGVYFESGYALGQVKKVIYLCNSEEFKKAHFDIRPLQHIVYNSIDQLKKDLVNKIEVWIK